MAYASWKQIQLTAKLNPADTSLTADVDIWVTNGRLYFSNDLQEEWISFTSVTSSGAFYVYWGLTRGLSQTANPATAGTGKTWLAWSMAVLTAMHDQIADTKASNTFTADQTIQGTLNTQDVRFTWTTTSGVRLKSLTTTQRNALTPSNGDMVYDSTLSEVYQYIGGAWSAVSAWSTQPNASTTVAGKVEIPTDSEVWAGTTTGGTGALLAIAVQNTSTTKVANRVPVLNASGLVTPFINTSADGAASTTEKGLTELATDAEALAGTSTSTVITPAQANLMNQFVLAKTLTTTTATFTDVITHNLWRIPTEIDLDIVQLSSQFSKGRYRAGTYSCIWAITWSDGIYTDKIGRTFESSGNYFEVTITSITTTTVIFTYTEVWSVAAGEDFRLLIRIK